jgi:hypothetical protein
MLNRTVSRITFLITDYRSRKTEQMRLSIEISGKLDEAENEIFVKQDELEQVVLEGNVQKKNSVERALHDARLLYLNHWEFFAFLVNTGELKNQRILDYYRPNFRSGVKNIFEKLPRIGYIFLNCSSIGINVSLDYSKNSDGLRCSFDFFLIVYLDYKSCMRFKQVFAYMESPYNVK